MLDTFPSGTDKGVDVAEVHPRKGDTLFHLLCHSKQFGPELAHVFKRLAVVSPPSLFYKANAYGFTFLSIAAASLNFWVLSFMLRNFQMEAKSLFCSSSTAPLRSLAEVIPGPTPPVFRPPAAFPEHFRAADMLLQDEGGAVPYADLAFDVGAEVEAGVAAGRFLAHRIVVATQSPVLLEAIGKTELTELSPGKEDRIRAAVCRVDPRISKEVWRSVLQFMYTGVISFPRVNDVEAVVELLLACTIYKLPQPLLEFTQACLYPLLPTSSPSMALQVFSICTGCALQDPDLASSREASAYILLRSAHVVFEAMDAAGVAQILEKVLQTAEHAALHPPPSAVATPPGAPPGIAAAAPAMLVQPSPEAHLRAAPAPLQVPAQPSEGTVYGYPRRASHPGAPAMPGAQAYGRTQMPWGRASLQPAQSWR